ncbi:cadherin-like protein [Mobilisporobacter senegalensis]|uniref:Cadherin-like protein n=1 Tax=Mobilisporobacter senegalensis TaxID=1329262 RepID=A0A3N1XNX9_9FIRM|nr:cadherin-like beta sandwich domain-containing protein [Mobilisporobacter senegalensis]ROR26437.1 cadherin-like protein [Mobilisporobacter senegalensis]
MKKRCIYLGLILILVINLIFNMNGITAHAASATIKFSTNSTVVTKGNNITVSLTLEAEEAIGEFEGYISYDADILEFIESGSFISGGDGVLRVAETSDTDGDTKKKYSMKFKAKEVGVGEIKLSETPFVYNYEEGKEMSVSSNQISINVKTTKRVSTETNLSDLKISPGTLTPKFDPYVYEYSTEVDSDVSSLIISGTAKDSNASVKVQGNNDLAEGKNTVTLTVKAESGDTKDYIIYVDKKAAATEDEPNADDSKDNFKITSEDGKTFIENKYRYEIIDVPEDEQVPAGYSKTKLILYGVNVTAYTKADDLENDFLLIYAMNEDGESGYYQYDRVEQTMQRYTGPLITDVNNTEDGVTFDEYNAKLTQLSIIIAVLSAVCILLILGIIKLYLKSKGFKENDLE